MNPLCFLLLPVLSLLSLSAWSMDKPASPDYQLKKLFILSRHSIRAPLDTYNGILTQITPKDWPAWQTLPGQLTPKGKYNEQRFGRYMRTWLHSVDLLPGTGCPKPRKIFVYTDSLSRTIESANNFLEGALPSCGILVYHKSPEGVMDPLFNPVLPNALTEAQKQKVRFSINQYLGDGGIPNLNKRLAPTYQVLENILDMAHSEYCLVQHHCIFAGLKNTLSLQAGQTPRIDGGVGLAGIVGEVFILQYLEGYPEKDVAWGHLHSPHDWDLAETGKNVYQDAVLSTPYVARFLAAPLLRFLDSAFSGSSPQDPQAMLAYSSNIAVLFGHDRNIISLLGALQTRPYHLPGQYEQAPISGKVLFEEWYDKHHKRDLMKIEYLYQPADQIRNATELTLQNPPLRVTLELTGCPADQQGFCSMKQFLRVLEQSILPL